jgi:peptidyl-tRNA hydrolase, PTH1 family
MDAPVSPYYLIVGLGNPGREYRYTRHNIGFMVIDKLAADLGIKLTKVQAKAIIGLVPFQGVKIILAKPQTYMNLSGQAVTSLMHFYKVPMEQFIVIHDDIDLPVSTIRIRPGGGSAGQKGLGSIIERLGTQSFARMRIGIGRPPGRMEAPDYVLQDFDKSEQPLMERVIAEASEAARTFISEGLDAVMNKYNGLVDG